MDDSEEDFPSLPSNYITILDLQKRWIEQQKQQQQQNNEALNDSILVSNPNSNFQNPNQLNPNSQNGNSCCSDFNGKKPPQSKKKRKNKYKKMKKRDELNSKFESVAALCCKSAGLIKPNSKDECGAALCRCSSAGLTQPNSNESVAALCCCSAGSIKPNSKDESVAALCRCTSAGLTKPNSKEESVAVLCCTSAGLIKPNSKEESVAALCCTCAGLHDRKGVYGDGQENGKLVEDGQKGVIEPNSKEGSVVELCCASAGLQKEKKRVYRKKNWKSRGPVRDGIQLHGGNEEMGNTAEIESKLKEVSLSENNWRPRGSKKGYTSYRRVDAVSVPVHKGSNEVHGSEVKEEVEKVKVDDENGKTRAETRGGYRREGRDNWGAKDEGGRGFRYGRSNAAMGPRGSDRSYSKFVWVKRTDLNDKPLN